MDDSAITCDEVLEPYNEGTKTIPTNFNEKKATCEMQISIFAFLLITIALLIAVSIYCFLIKYRAGQKHL